MAQSGKEASQVRVGSAAELVGHQRTVHADRTHRHRQLQVVSPSGPAPQRSHELSGGRQRGWQVHPAGGHPRGGHRPVAWAQPRLRAHALLVPSADGAGVLGGACSGQAGLAAADLHRSVSGRRRRAGLVARHQQLVALGYRWHPAAGRAQRRLPRGVQRLPAAAPGRGQPAGGVLALPPAVFRSTRPSSTRTASRPCPVPIAISPASSSRH